MSAHTPAPWHGVGGEIRATHPNQNGLHVATVWSHGDRQTAANERLIAAAPDLLEAARLAVSLMEQFFQTRQGAATVKMLRQAIAKAEGGAS